MLKATSVFRHVAFFYGGPKAPPPGQLDKDSTHSGTFSEKFREIAQKRGIVCRRGSLEDMASVLKPSK